MTRVIILALTALVTVVACAGERSPYDQSPPSIGQHYRAPGILVFSKTAGWRHDAGIAGANLFLAELMESRGQGIFTTENGSVFNPDDLERFDLVVFNNVTDDVLSPDQRAAFEAWFADGGAWIGLHSAGDNTHQHWPWYQDNFIGTVFTGHPADPQFQAARLVNLRPSHPVMAGIPSSWQMRDEWYSFDAPVAPPRFVPLAGLDESSYAPENFVYGDVSDLRMGPTPADHPIIWVSCVGTGRAVYSAVGHLPQVYNNSVYRRLLAQAIDWTTGATDPAAAGCPEGQDRP